MIKYTIRALWRQKRSNLYILLEMFGIFVALFFGVIAVSEKVEKHMQESAFTINENVFRFAISQGAGADKCVSKIRELKDFVKSLSGVKAVSLSSYGIPYGMNTSTRTFKIQGDTSSVHPFMMTRQVDQSFAEILGIKMLQGKWISDGADLSGEIPVVITQDLADEFFTNENALGKKFLPTKDHEAFTLKIIGIIPPFQQTLYSKTLPSIFLPIEAHPRTIPFDMMVSFATDNTLEKELALRQIQDYFGSSTWRLFDLCQMNDLEENSKQEATYDVKLIVLVVVFLLVNLMLGLVGIFGYSAKKRISELALHRAIGASTGSVVRMLLSEMLALAVMGIVPGIVLVLQINVFGYDTSILHISIGIVVSTALILSLVAVSVSFPILKVVRFEPALALKEE